MKNTFIHGDRLISNSLSLLTIFLYFIPIQITAQPNHVESNSVYSGKAEIAACISVTLKPGFHALPGSNIRVYTDHNLVLPEYNYQPVTGNIIVNASPSASQNYILTTTLREATSNPANINQTAHSQVVEYFDGLGRPLQTVSPKGSPQMKDIVTPFSYDELGRTDKNYLPFVSDNSSGAYNTNAYSQCIAFYNGQLAGFEADNTPFSTILYDNSPLNRVTGEIGVGENWSNKPKAVNYISNTSQVKHWKVSGASPVVFFSFYYQPNSLFITENVDENGNIQRVFTDKFGQTIRTEAVGEGGGILRTSYIYDDLGLLRCIVPPKVTDADGPTNGAELCYFYNYDNRRRIIEKKSPGAEWVYNVYDRRDRLAMWQDGVNRTSDKWQYILYDAHNRPVLTGILTTSHSVETIRYSFSVFTGPIYELWTPTGALFGYSGGSFPASYTPTPESVQTVTWYDTYDFLQAYGSSYDFPPVPPGGTTGNSYILNVKGQVTGNAERVNYNGKAPVNQYLITVNYYDVRRRLLCSVSDNHLGGRNNLFFGYNFNDQVIEKIISHDVSFLPGEQIVLISNYTFDHQGRPLEEKLRLNGNDPVTIRAWKYNETGTTISEYLHGSETGLGFHQKTDYTYNIRGWLRKLNDPENIGNKLFALELRYENPMAGGAVVVDPIYNGNISQMLWNSKYDTQRGFGFKYDKLNRITQAKYGQGIGYAGNSGWFNAIYSYDANGNMATLARKRSNIAIDLLTYTYYNNGKSNRLLSVNDQGTADGYVPATGQYLYDENAAMIYDPSKKIYVAYNHLNLPTKIEFDNDDFISYDYAAGGARLRKTVNAWKTASGGVTDYTGPFKYSGNELSSIFTAAGRIIPVYQNGSVLWKYEYNLTDHLGNVRVVFATHSHGQPEVLQQTDYYPFGMTMQQQDYYGVASEANKLLYNGKELQDDELAGSRLDWYDYGFRFYDPVTGRLPVLTR